MSSADRRPYLCGVPQRLFRELAGTVRDLLERAGTLLLCLVVCTLPRKTWDRFGGILPVGSSPIPAAVLALLAGALLGFFGFLDFAADTASRNNQAMLEIAETQASSGAAQEPAASLAMPVSLTMLSALAFAFFTPFGLSCTYLFVSGFYRILSAILDDPRGDPLLGLVHAAWTRSRARQRETRARKAREEQEGPEVRDRLLDPERAGMPGANLVVVASRRKPDWTPGTILDTGDRFYRVGPAVDRSLPVGLRTFYPLTEVPGAEVLRRIVRYDAAREARADLDTDRAPEGLQAPVRENTFREWS